MRLNRILAVMAVVLACSTTSRAQSAQPPRFATVNVAKVFEKYYKKDAADAAFKEFVQGLEKQSKDLGASVQKANTEYRDLTDKSNDQASSAAEREKNKLAAEAKLKEVKDLDQTYQEFAAAARTKADEKYRQFMEKLLGEIKEAVSAKAKGAGYTLVFDSAAVGPNSVPIILYSNGDSDLTEAVLDQLNAAAAALAVPAKTAPKP